MRKKGISTPLFNSCVVRVYVCPSWGWYFLYTNANVYTQRHSVLSFENEFINVKDVKSL